MGPIDGLMVPVYYLGILWLMSLFPMNGARRPQCAQEKEKPPGYRYSQAGKKWCANDKRKFLYGERGDQCTMCDLY